jgi:competence protein ComEA
MINKHRPMIAIGPAVEVGGGNSIQQVIQALRLTLFTLILALAPVLFSAQVSAEDAAPAAAQTVNINTADALALSAGLNGVGLTRAEEIIRHREAFGPFASVDELTEVKGIGQSTLDKNRKLITLE